MSKHHTKSFFSIHMRRELGIALLLALLAFALWSVVSVSSHMKVASTSPEVSFTDNSKSGLSIVPASCPSDPHFAGDCAPPPPPPPTGGGCAISADPPTLASGQATTLFWSATNANFLFVSVPPSNIVLSNIGTVAQSGSTLVSPGGTTIYTLSGTYNFFGFPTGSFSCSQQVTVDTVTSSCPQNRVYFNGQCVSSCPAGYVKQGNQCVSSSCLVGYTFQNGSCVFTGCPSGYAQQGNQCVLQSCSAMYVCVGANLYYRDASCSQTRSQTCSYGCSGGACLAPPPPDGSLSVSPSLVKKGETVKVTWLAHNAASCTVSAGNGDSWNSDADTQTSKPILSQMIYTLSCLGLDTTTLIKQATVNIVPSFVEH